MAESKEGKVCPCCKTKHRDPDEYQDLIRRLNRIEGQVRGVRVQTTGCFQIFQCI